MVRQFKLGGVYECEIGIKDEAIGASFLIKVVGFHDGLQYRIFEKSKRSLDELIGGTPACVRTAVIAAPPFSDITMDYYFGYARPIDYDLLDAEVISLYFPLANGNYSIVSSSDRVILKTEVLLFCATKLIILARRVKERMYAPGGIGFIAAQEDFDRVTKSQRIE